jgi:Flp pilus assembly protein TadG
VATRASSRRFPGGDAGAAVVDFVLVGSLLTLLFLAVLQVAVDVYVRNVLAAAAADGARYAANADVADPQAGADRANELIRSSLGASFAHARPAADVRDVDGDGAPVVGVTVSARLPLLAWFLPVGPTVTVTGHALAEPPR